MGPIIPSATRILAGPLNGFAISAQSPGMHRMDYTSIAALVTAHYDKIDLCTGEFRDQTGLNCPVGCGNCCESTEVEAAPVELLPLAVMLWETGAEADALTRLEGAATRACVFHRPDELCHGQGRCSIYPWRPLTCRLFGYAAVRLKTGQLEMTICSLVRKLAPGVVLDSARIIESGLVPLVFSDVATEVRNIDWNLGRDVMSINDAALLAIERVGFERALREGEATGTLDVHPHDPKTPRRVA